LTVDLAAFTLPSVEFEPGETVVILPRYGLPGGKTDELDELWREGLASGDLTDWMRLALKYQIVSWTIRGANGEPIPIPADDPGFYKAPLLGAFELIAKLCLWLRTGAETCEIEVAPGHKVYARAGGDGVVRPVPPPDTPAQQAEAPAPKALPARNRRRRGK